MYLRCNLQPRAEQNLSKYTQIYAEREAEGNRVTKGHVLSKLLASYPTLHMPRCRKVKSSNLSNQMRKLRVLEFK